MQGEWLSNDPALGPDDPGSLLELYLPPNVATLRGVVFMHGRGTPERPSHTRGMVEVAQAWSFAMVRGYIWDLGGERLSDEEQVELLTKSMKGWAERTAHPELEHVPILAIGESRTASLPPQLETFFPGRLIGSSQVVGGIDAAQAAAPLLTVPSMVIPSELDEMEGKLQRHFLAGRARDALWAGTVQWKHPHGFYEAWDVDWPYFNELVRLRVPRDQTAESGPVALKALRLEEGWLGDASQWTGFNAIAPYGEFQGDRSKAAWLPSEAAAFAWRAFSVPDPKLAMTKPTTSYNSWSSSPLAFGRIAPLNLNRESQLELEAESLAEPAPIKVEFYAGAQLLGASEGPSPYKLSVQGLLPGVHAIIAIGTFADGHRETSRPANVAIMPDEGCR